MHVVTAAIELKAIYMTQLMIQKGKKGKKIELLKAKAKKYGIAITDITPKKLEDKTQSSHHQGIAAVVNNDIYEDWSLSDFLAQLKNQFLILVLEDVQDPHNLGACLRNANAAGVDAVVINRYGSTKMTPIVSKVASGGAENTVLITVTNISKALTLLKEKGAWIYGTDGNTTNNIFNTDFTTAKSVVFVMGKEESGLKLHTKKNCDQLISIPMQGVVQSLNLATATGVCLFEYNRQMAS